MSTKLLLESIRQADDGRVECALATPDGRIVQGVISEKFFELFQGLPNLEAPATRARIIRDNVEFVEGEANRQLSMGLSELVI